MTTRTAIAMLILSLACALGFAGMMTIEVVSVNVTKMFLIPTLILVIWAGYLLLTGLMAPPPQPRRWQ